MTDLPAVRLKIERRSSHPWIFQKMVERPAVRLPPGSVVLVREPDFDALSVRAEEVEVLLRAGPEHPKDPKDRVTALRLR